MKHLTYEQILHRFLKNRRAYSKFIRNNDQSYTHYSDNECKVHEFIVNCGFDWDSSPEGYNYWSNVSHEWRQLCNNFNLNGKRYVK